MSTRPKLAAANTADYFVYYRALDSGKTIAHQEDARVETASVVKLPILLAVLDKVQKRELSLRQTVPVRRADVGKNGSGVMQYFYLHRPFELYNLLVLMMSISDNVATNVVVRLVGRNSINRYLRSSGFTQTELVSEKLDFSDSFSLETSGKTGLTTPQEMALLVERLITGRLLDQTNTKLAMKLMQQVRNASFSRRLPRSQIKQFGSKPGGLIDDAAPFMVLNEAGYIIDNSDKTYIFSLFSKLSIDRQYYELATAADAAFAKQAARLFRDLRQP